MSKVAVVYTSTTGNTEKMAEAVADGAKKQGAEVALLGADAFTAADVDSYDAIAFGCPSMGVEQLEETAFEPMFASIEGSLSGKKIALFGSYGWGDGEWMRNWQERVNDDGAVLIQDGVMANYEPDDDAIAECKALGEALA